MRARVLVVDDDRSMFDWMESSLSRRSYAVSTATSAFSLWSMG